MKNCPKCNAELADDAMFCNVCGEKLEAPAKEDAKVTEAKTEEAETPVATNDTLDAADTKAKNEKTGKIVVIAGVAAAILVALIVVLIVSGANAYKKPIKQLVNNINKHNTNVESYLDICTPAFVGKTYSTVYDIVKGTSKDAIDELNETINGGFEEIYDGIEDEYGDHWKIKYTIRSKDKMKKKDLKAIKDQCKDLADQLERLGVDDEDLYDSLSDMLEDEYDKPLKEKDIQKLAKLGDAGISDLKSIKITDGYEVKLRIDIKGSDDSDDTTLKIQVIKVNGKWIINPLGNIEVDGNSMGSVYNYIR